MKENDFFPGMKVYLDGEFGVVTNKVRVLDSKYDVDNLECQNIPTTQYGLIRWDTKEIETEDWIGLFGTFLSSGGKRIEDDHVFKFINDDGSSITID